MAELLIGGCCLDWFCVLCYLMFVAVWFVWVGILMLGILRFGLMVCWCVTVYVVCLGDRDLRIAFGWVLVRCFADLLLLFWY